ncbi:MAG: ribonuclease III [Sphingomonadales bacterium]|nr:ribonuclease III [Sphingomonadales bacterium]
MVRALDLVHRGAVEPDRGNLLSEPAIGAETRAFLVRFLGTEGAAGGDALWHEALTHGSMGEARDYQRLEFLGDRVLGLVIAEWLHETLDAREGTLSQRLNALVARSMCATIGRGLGLGPHIRLGKQARDDGAADSDNILGDVIEALVGAAFLALGFAGARAVVRRLWEREFTGAAGHAKHPKSALQEWAAEQRRKMPEYRLVAREGPDHAARFTVAVAIRGVGEAAAEGASKQEAETEAARSFLERFA